MYLSTGSKNVILIFTYQSAILGCFRLVVSKVHVAVRCNFLYCQLNLQNSSVSSAQIITL